MVREIKVSSMKQVSKIVEAATTCFEDVGIHDELGAIADAKSILGLMSLDYTKPVRVVSEDTHALETICRAIAQ